MQRDVGVSGLVGIVGALLRKRRIAEGNAQLDPAGGGEPEDFPRFQKFRRARKAVVIHDAGRRQPGAVRKPRGLGGRIG